MVYHWMTGKMDRNYSETSCDLVIQGVSKMTGQTSRRSSSHPNKDIYIYIYIYVYIYIYKHLSGKEFLCEYSWKITFNNNTRSQVSNWSVVIVHEITIHNAQNVLHVNQYTWVHVWSWTVAPFQTSQVACKSFGRHKKCVSEVSIFNSSLIR
jgi:hypothetical protein